MTRKTAKGAKSGAKKTKRLSVNKATMKDLTPRGAGAKAVKGGVRMTDGCSNQCRTFLICL
jgi:hypothetical protein